MDPKQTLRSPLGKDLNDENRKQVTYLGNPSVPETSCTTSDMALSQFSKKRKIRMGPQECLEYSSSSQGASALTTPQLLLKSKEDVNNRLYPIQRGRSHGSCFISAPEQAQFSMRKGDHLPSSSKRQYMSPSKGTGTNLKSENQRPVYDSSGFVRIGSPKQKNQTQSQCVSRSPKGLDGKSQSVANNWRASTNVWKKTSNSLSPTQSPPANQKFMSQPNSKVSHLQSNTAIDKSLSQSSKSLSKSTYQSSSSRPTSQYPASPNKWKKTSSSANVVPPNKGSTDAPCLRSPSSKMLPSHQSSQSLSQHAPTHQQHQHLKGNIRQHSVSPEGNVAMKHAMSQSSRFHSVQQSMGNSSSNQPAQTTKKSDTSPKKQTLVTDFYTKTPPKETESDCKSSIDHDLNTSVKRDLNQTWGTGLNKFPMKRSNQHILSERETGNLKVRATTNDKKINSGLLKQSPLKMDLDGSWKTQDEDSDQTELPTSQGSSTGSCNLTSLSIHSQGETDLQAEGRDLKEAETLSLSQQSSSSATRIGPIEDPEHDCIEDLLKDYEIDENGYLRLSQSSSGHSGNGDPISSGEKTDSNDPDDHPDSSDESQSLLRTLHGIDDDESEETLLLPKEETKAQRVENFGVNDKSACTSAFQASFPSKKESKTQGTKVKKTSRQGTSTSSDNSAVNSTSSKGQWTECGLASSSSVVYKNDMSDRSCTIQENHNLCNQSPELGESTMHPAEVEVNFGDMPDEEEIPEELLEQIEAGALLDDGSLKERTFGLVGNGSEEEENGEQTVDFFSHLPVEVIENIFCRIPIVDLMLSCAVVCHQWANIIACDSFIPWKKAYNRCKSGQGAWTSPLENSKKESCLLDVIRFLSTLSRKPGESTVVDLQRHSNYEFAKDLIAENLPDLIKDGSPHPWSTVAALAVVAETVDDIQEIFRCLLHPSSTNTPTAVTEVMYSVATLLLSLQKQHNLCRRLHFRVFYALFLYENDTKPSTVQLKGDRVAEQQMKFNHHSISGKFPLTQEQLRIVNHKLDCEKNEVIKVVAFAGTGKTTTLIKFAEANIYHHLLYVAFNKSVQVEACRVFPGNTECRTSHSLAYEKLKHKYGKKLTFDLKPHMINDLIPKRPKDEKSPLQWALYARLVGESLKNFMASADEFITSKHVPEQYSTASTFLRPLTHHDRMSLLKDAEYLWGRMIDETDYEAKITHDGYFKVYQLSKPVITDIQCLLIDEAQDLTPAQQDVLLSQPLPKILVGDPHQQIYSFRGATNAMDAIQADKVYHLTQSFRFGSEIAYAANCILDVYKHMTKHTIVGKEEEGTLCGEEVGQKAIICRGNTSLFSQAVKLCDMEGQENLRLGFTGFGEGHYCKSGFNFDKLMDLYKMSAGASGRSLKNDLFRKMQTFGNLETYAQNAEDSELLSLINIVKMYNHRIPELINKIKSKTAKELQYATVVLTTAHKSKGLEFDTVQLADDFKMFRPRVNMGEEGLMVITDDCNIPDDEKNLIYVAVTRTKKSLRLNEGLRKCLGKASEQFKFPISTKQFLECAHNLEEQRCLDCGVPIIEMKRITMAKVWSVKLVSSSQHVNHPTNSGGFICSDCSYHHLPGFEKIFLGAKTAPQAASIT